MAVVTMKQLLESGVHFGHPTRRWNTKMRRDIFTARGGIYIIDLTRRPDAIFVIDTRKEEIAVKEARKLRVPIIAVVDTNCDPDVVDFVIPGNDDAIRSGSLLARVIADAVADGLGARPPEVIAAAEAAAASGVTYTAGGEEPPAEWEIMLAQEEAEKVRRAKEEIVPELAAAPAAAQAPPPQAPAPAAPPPAGPAEESADEEVIEPPRPILIEEEVPRESLEEELKVIYKDEEEGRRR